MRKNRIRMIAVLAAVTALVFLTSCARAKSEAYDTYAPVEYKSEEVMEADADYYDDDVMVEGGNGITDLTDIKYEVNDLKLIYNASVSFSTEQFDEDVLKVKTAAAGFKGYVSNEVIRGTKPEKQSDGGRYTDITVRIPTENYNAFISMLSGMGKNTYMSQNVNDVTDQYYDVETRLEVLELSKGRLEELLKKAEEMEDIISLNQELSDITYQIENLKGSKRYLDNRIAYSTVTVSIAEVFKATIGMPEEESLGSRISDEFNENLVGVKTFFEDLAVTFIGASPVIIIILVIGAVIFVIVRAVRKKRALRAPKEKETKAEEAVLTDNGHANQWPEDREEKQ